MLIAILEDDPARVEPMTSWLVDRLYMYDRAFSPDLPSLFGVITPRLADVLVLCLSHDVLSRAEPGIDRAWGEVTECLGMSRDQFPILVHGGSASAPDDSILKLVQRGWRINTIGPAEGSDWIGKEWYPSLKKAIRSMAEPAAPINDLFSDSVPL